MFSHICRCGRGRVSADSPRQILLVRFFSSEKMISRALLLVLHVVTSLACLTPAPTPAPTPTTTTTIKPTSVSTLFTYPESDKTYGVPKEVKWLLQIAAAQEVKLTFETFETSPSNDVLEIYDGDVKVAYFTGKSVPLYPTFVKADNSKVKFAVGSNKTLAGFTIRAEYVAAGTSTGDFTFDKNLQGWSVAHSTGIWWKHQRKDGSNVGNIKFDSTSPTGNGGWAELVVQYMSISDWAELISPEMDGVSDVSLWRLKMNVNDHFTKSSFRVLLRQKNKQDKLIWQNDNNGGFYETVPFSEWTHREIDIRLPSAGSSFQIVIKVVNINLFGRGNRRVGIDDVTISPADPPETSFGEACGVNQRIENRVFNGKPSDSHRWPWLVVINIATETAVKSCTGSILNKRWILTAAHCFTASYNSEIKWAVVLFGVHARSSYSMHAKDADEYATALNLSDIYSLFNEKFSKDGANVSYLDQDVALLKLPVDLQFTSKVSPLCLPKKNDELPLGTMLTFAGWGYNPNATNNRELNEVELKLVDKNCSLENNHHLCTYSPGRDVCAGDSGGPGMIFDQTRNQWKLVASVVAGPRCDKLADGTSTAIAYMADIIGIIDWINHIMKTY